jgi:septum formation topological specificity factor MinE
MLLAFSRVMRKDLLKISKKFKTITRAFMKVDFWKTQRKTTTGIRLASQKPKRSPQSEKVGQRPPKV